MARVAVVGAGLGGLAAAARLAALGHAVTVHEQAEQVGGKLGWFERGGHAFDTGPSLVTLPHLFADLFAATGGRLEDAVDLVRLEPAVGYRFADGTALRLPGEADRIPAALDAALGDGAGAQWSALLDRAAAMWAVTEEPFLRSPLRGAATLARLARSRGDVATVAPLQSLRTLGRRYLTDPRLRDAAGPLRHLLRLRPTPGARGAGHRPLRRAAVRLLVRPRRAAPAGRGRRRAGGRVRRRRPHRDRGGRGAGRRGPRPGLRLADGSGVPADVVVSGADAAALYGGLLPRGRATAAVRRDLGRTTPSLSGFVLLLALRGRTPDLTHHTVLFPEDYDAEFDAVFGTGRYRRPQPVEEPTVYVSAPDDPALRPADDTESWFVLVNAPRHDPEGGVDWDEPGLADRYAQRVLEVMARRGLDVRDRLRWCVARTPADLERETGSPGGSIYGTSSNGPRAAFLRPANASPVRGLYLVGGSAHPGGGLPLVVLSAEIVAGLVGAA